ncbi:MAG: hypothetical protein NTY64_12670 [Deltaproteobacteria bacterium]|nr:hypothetical protein [Deltaproteobacteria bacterium]
MACLDGFVKSPSAALRFIFVAAAYHPSTPHSSVPLRAGLRAGSRETRESFFLWRLFTRPSFFILTRIKPWSIFTLGAIQENSGEGGIGYEKAF